MAINMQNILEQKLKQSQQRGQTMQGDTQTLQGRLDELDKFNQERGLPQITAPRAYGENPLGILEALGQMTAGRSRILGDVSEQNRAFQAQQGQELDIMKMLADTQTAGQEPDYDILQQLNMKEKFAKQGYGLQGFDAQGQPILGELDKAGRMKADLGSAKYQGAVNDLMNAEAIIDDIISQSEGIASGRIVGRGKNFLSNYMRVGNYRNYDEFKTANLGKIARAISGEVGVLNEWDIQRAEGLFPRPDDYPDEADKKIRMIKDLLDARRNVLGLEALAPSEFGQIPGATTPTGTTGATSTQPTAPTSTQATSENQNIIENVNYD